VPRGEVFASDEPLRLIVEADFRRLGMDRTLEPEERPGRVILSDSTGEPREIPVLVRTRGHFRLRPTTCELPPLRLDFPRSLGLGTVLDGQDKVKLVTHCRDRGDYEQNLLEEYLAYRLYNLVTPVSFRVQLAEVTYLDTSGSKGPVTRKAFLIEGDDALAGRLGGEALDVPGLQADLLEREELGLMYVFQYMIGNTDWSAESGHNVTFVRVGKEAIHPVPYDFDFAGLVDAPYAGPAPSLADSIRSVRDRHYLGRCVEGVDLEAVLIRFREIRQAALALAETQPFLSTGNRRGARRYLQEFFEEIENPNRVRENIGEACRR
jgi:hypothetical protein